MKKLKGCFKGCLIVILSIFVIWIGFQVYRFVSDRITGHRFLGDINASFNWSRDGRYLFYLSKNNINILDTKDYSTKSFKYTDGGDTYDVLPDNKSIVYLNETNSNIILKNLYTCKSKILFRGIKTYGYYKMIFYINKSKCLFFDGYNTYLLDAGRKIHQIILPSPFSIEKMNLNLSGFCYIDNNKREIYYYDLNRKKSMRLDMPYSVCIYYVKDNKILYYNYNNDSQNEYMNCYDMDTHCTYKTPVDFVSNAVPILSYNNNHYATQISIPGDFPFVNHQRADIYRTPKSLVKKINRLLNSGIN